jgi:hypothetical protein
MAKLKDERFDVEKAKAILRKKGIPLVTLSRLQKRAALMGIDLDLNDIRQIKK